MSDHDDVIVLLCLLIGGRVIPMFTRNATGATWIASPPILDVLTAVTMAVVTLADVLDQPHAQAETALQPGDEVSLAALHERLDLGFGLAAFATDNDGSEYHCH